MRFEDAIERVLAHEGGYSRHPDDPGGETNWGVTARTARSAGFRGDMRSMTREDAKRIYLASYWTPILGDKLPDHLAFHVFDAAVNSGVHRAIEWLQAIVGTEVDGLLGPKTLAAAQASDALAGARYAGLRLDFMTRLPTWGSFGKGWARRVAANLMEA